MMMSGDDVLTEPVARRVEVFTGAGRRRRWSAEAKARIVAESYARSVGEVADLYGLAKTQLFTWRREAKSPRDVALEPAFAPVVLEQRALPRSSAAVKAPSPRKMRRSRRGGIELEIDGVVIRVQPGAEAKTVSAVIRALKAQR